MNMPTGHRISYIFKAIAYSVETSVIVAKLTTPNENLTAWQFGHLRHFDLVSSISNIFTQHSSKGICGILEHIRGSSGCTPALYNFGTVQVVM